MAITYGFFDAHLSEGVYDRLYNASNLVEYCAKIIGSGVAVTESQDSFLVSYADNVVSIQPGYLFIQGYWLKSDEVVTMTLNGAGEFIIYAQLDSTARLIRLTNAAAGTTPADCLILGRVNTTTGSVIDTRPDTSVCGIIDTAGSLSDRVTSVQQYIESNVEAVLFQLEGDVTNEVTQLNLLQSEAQSLIENINVPVGEVKFSLAAQDVRWLKCDGSFIAKATYPALCNLLGGHSLTSRVSRVYSQNVGNFLSNACLYDGKLWFIEWSNLRMISVDLDTGDSVNYGLSAIIDSINGEESSSFSEPTTARPLCFSVCNGRFYLSQPISSPEAIPPLLAWKISDGAIVGTGVMALMTRSRPDTTQNPSTRKVLPYVSEIRADGTDYVCIMAFNYNGTGGHLNIPNYYRTTRILDPSPDDVYTSTDFERSAFTASSGADTATGRSVVAFPVAFHPKNSGGAVSVGASTDNTSDPVKTLTASLSSYPNVHAIARETSTTTWTERPNGSQTALPVMGASTCLLGVDIKTNRFVFYSIKYSTRLPYIVEFPMTITSDADVFLESIVYADGTFFIFVGNGMFATKDPTDIETYSYVDFTVLDGFKPIKRFACANYDDVNQRLVLSGVDSSGNTVVYLVSLNRWNVSDNGAYLPKISRNGVPAYIKAVAG